MKKFVVLSTLLLTAGLAYAATPSRGSLVLQRGTVLNPFTLQVVSATRLNTPRPIDVTPIDDVIPVLPPIPLDPGMGDVRPGPFTPPPRSPYVPPPR